MMEARALGLATRGEWTRAVRMYARAARSYSPTLKDVGRWLIVTAASTNLRAVRALRMHGARASVCALARALRAWQTGVASKLELLSGMADDVCRSDDDDDDVARLIRYAACVAQPECFATVVRALQPRVDADTAVYALNVLVVRRWRAASPCALAAACGAAMRALGAAQLPNEDAYVAVAARRAVWHPEVPLDQVAQRLDEDAAALCAPTRESRSNFARDAQGIVRACVYITALCVAARWSAHAELAGDGDDAIRRDVVDMLLPTTQESIDAWRAALRDSDSSASATSVMHATCGRASATSSSSSASPPTHPPRAGVEHARS